MQERKKKKVKDYGIYIPPRIARMIRLKILSFEEAGIYSLIDALENLKLGCTAHIAHFAKRLNMGERSVKRYIAKLIKMKLVEVISFNGRTRKLRTVASKAVKEVEDASNGMGAKLARHPSQIGTALRSSNNYVHKNGRAVYVQGGFLDKENSDTKEYKLATRFAKFIGHVTKHKPQWEIKSQLRYLNSLIKRVGFPRVVDTLEWYTNLDVSNVNGIGQLGVKVALTLQEFEKQFDRIEASMHRIEEIESEPKYSGRAITHPSSNRSLDELAPD